MKWEHRNGKTHLWKWWCRKNRKMMFDSSGRWLVRFVTKMQWCKEEKERRRRRNGEMQQMRRPRGREVTEQRFSSLLYFISFLLLQLDLGLWNYWVDAIRTITHPNLLNLTNQRKLKIHGKEEIPVILIK